MCFGSDRSQLPRYGVWGPNVPVRLAAPTRLQGMLRYPKLTRDYSTIAGAASDAEDRTSSATWDRVAARHRRIKWPRRDKQLIVQCKFHFESLSLRLLTRNVLRFPDQPARQHDCGSEADHDDGLLVLRQLPGQQADESNADQYGDDGLYVTHDALYRVGFCVWYCAGRTGAAASVRCCACSGTTSTIWGGVRQARKNGLRREA